MPGLAVDTHALVWMLMTPQRLSPRARAEIQRACDAGEMIHVPTICLVEIASVIERRRLPDDVWQRVLSVVRGGSLALVPLDTMIVETVRRVSPVEVPDLPDRIIAATAGFSEFPSCPAIAASQRPPLKPCGKEVTCPHAVKPVRYPSAR